MVLAGDDTIAAIATALGYGGIGIVRISGKSLLPLAENLTARVPTARNATLVDFIGSDGVALDRGVLLYFPAPNSFTGEDVLELQGHGGPIVMQMLLHRCLELGARLAEPGEFSKRAFLNGKLDLAQAEAVADLIKANSEAAARSALKSLSGVFSSEVTALVQQLIELRMLVEATLDFPEEEIDVLKDTDAQSRLGVLRANLAGLRSRARAGSRLRSGLQVALVGIPNVGKSSLMNCLVGEDRSIVTDIAGTTRDAVRETLFLRGMPLHVVDTAGLRESSDQVEMLGMKRTWDEVGRADVILHLVDARHGVTEFDRELGRRFPRDIQHIVVENKCDLLGGDSTKFVVDGRVHLRVSAKRDLGMDLLRDELMRIAGWAEHGEDVILARARHLEALDAAAAYLDSAGIDLGQIELCADDLRKAQGALSAITGSFTADDLLGQIFSNFCIGK